MDEQDQKQVTFNSNINFRELPEGEEWFAVLTGEFPGRAPARHLAGRAPELSKAAAKIVQPVWAAERKRLLLRIFAGIERQNARTPERQNARTPERQNARTPTA